MRYDAAIVGGGPAGLNAALVLARCRRSVVVIDAGKPRNYAARHLHNFLSREGVNPARLLAMGRREVARLGVEFRSDVVCDAVACGGGFSLRLKSRRVIRARTLLLATGVVDELPRIGNVEAFYGVGVHHCPYCDGYTYSDRALCAYGEGHAGLGLALNLLTWTRNVTVLTNGCEPDRKIMREAARFGIRVCGERIEGLVSRRGKDVGSERDPLRGVRLGDGTEVACDGLFFNTEQTQRSGLPRVLGCRIDESGGVIHDKRQRTGVSGLYLAGDASVDVQFVIVAAAEGAKAGMAMNREMQMEDRARERSGDGDRESAIGKREDNRGD